MRRTLLLLFWLSTLNCSVLWWILIMIFLIKELLISLVCLLSCVDTISRKRERNTGIWLPTWCLAKLFRSRFLWPVIPRKVTMLVLLDMLLPWSLLFLKAGYLDPSSLFLLLGRTSWPAIIKLWSSLVSITLVSTILPSVLLWTRIIWSVSAT